jgi:tRNA (mo5U34)-methyltransferase
VAHATEDLLARARERSWYHAIELAPGYVTPGWFDLRPHVHRYELPERMDGLRALDVGTWDGFWAFEMERRGADVVALDVDEEHEYDWPPRRRPQRFEPIDRGGGFRLAKEILGSSVERVSCNIYETRPEDLGTFDVVLCGSMLSHLRDQLLALERIAGLCRGTFISAEAYDRWADLVPLPVSRYLADREPAVVFWLPSRRTWRRMLYTAGFDHVEKRGRFKMRAGANADAPFAVPHVVHHASRRP